MHVRAPLRKFVNQIQVRTNQKWDRETSDNTLPCGTVVLINLSCQCIDLGIFDPQKLLQFFDLLLHDHDRLPQFMNGLLFLNEDFGVNLVLQGSAVVVFCGRRGLGWCACHCIVCSWRPFLFAVHPCFESCHSHLHKSQNTFNCSSTSIDDIINILGMQLKSELAKRLGVQGVPVVQLFIHSIRSGVVVQLHQIGKIVVHNLRGGHPIREVSCNVSLRPRQRDLIYPVVQPLQLFI
mmetsp:Transcript_45440/g.98614  ORF Transcript_45440/g.98614 Transcript_45440/m.98614 type:complete len:236 (-) Transcript_45440:92-799(-)